MPSRALLMISFRKSTRKARLSCSNKLYACLDSYLAPSIHRISDSLNMDASDDRGDNRLRLGAGRRASRSLEQTMVPQCLQQLRFSARNSVAVAPAFAHCTNRCTRRKVIVTAQSTTDNWINPHTRIEQESRCISLQNLPSIQPRTGLSKFNSFSSCGI